MKTAAPASAAGNDLLDAYLDALYQVPTAAGTLHLVVGRRVNFAPPQRDHVHALLTACNPGSTALPDDENHARQARLGEALAAHGLPWRAATSHAADGRWQEASCWITDIAPTLLDQLAERFGQNASLTIADDGRCRLRIHRDDWLHRDTSDDRLQWPN